MRRITRKVLLFVSALQFYGASVKGVLQTDEYLMKEKELTRDLGIELHHLEGIAGAGNV